MAQTITTKLKSPMEQFYSKYFFFSYSSLNKLINSAQLFYNWYILKDRKDSYENHLVEGKVIHCLLLDRKMFDDNFVIMPGTIPGASNKKIAEAMYKLWKEEQPAIGLPDFKDQILKWLVDNNLHQSLTDDKDLTKQGSKTGDVKRLEKILTAETIEYFNYLKSSGKKDVIDQATLERCEEAVGVLKDNKKINDLLKIGLHDFELLEVHNERALACKVQGYPFGLQGIVDNYVIDHTNKQVFINDLKTTGKSLSEFRDSLNYYRYWLQAAIYERLVKSHHPETKDFKFKFHFVVIDKYNQVYPFPVNDETMLDWQAQLEEALQIANYHYTNKDYTLPYEFAIGQVTL